MEPSANSKIIANQESYLIEIPSVQAAVTKRAGMLGPVQFHRNTSPIQPYSISPWAEEPLDASLPPIIEILRGDFMCSAFGANEEPFEGRPLPVHGETANERWTLVAQDVRETGSVLKLAMDMPVQGGRCESHTALVRKNSLVYQRHDFKGIDGPINPGHHATLRFPDHPGSGRVSFSKFAYAHTFIDPAEDPAMGGYSFLKPDQPVMDLNSVPCIDGTKTDVTVYPARRGYEDILILCADVSLDFVWSAATFQKEGYVWYSIRNPHVLPFTLLWMSNGGRHYGPWSGRHVNVMGIEDMTGFFHIGLAASARGNMLSEKGFKTCHRLTPDQTLSVNYIQGVARTPEGFDCVRDIRIESEDRVVLIAESGVTVSVRCHHDFIRSGRLLDLIE